MTDSAALDFLLEKMTQLINSDDELIVEAYRDKRIIELLYEEMQFLRKFLKDLEENRDEYDEEVKGIVANIRDVTYRVEDIMDGFLLQVIRQKHRHDALRQKRMGRREFIDHFLLFLASLFCYFINNEFPCPINVLIWKCHIFLLSYSFFFLFFDCLNWFFITCGFRYLIRMLRWKLRYYLFLNFRDVTKEIKLIKTQVMKIYEEKMYGTGIRGILQIGNPSRIGASSRPNISPTLEKESIVGFHDEAMTIMELLTEEHEKQLKVVSIIGMPGLGKTTLAIKVYDNPLIKYYFHICAWTCVSPVYQKRDLLLAIFRSAFQFKHEICEMSDEKLGEDLYRRLKGRTYLIVLDDIWTVQAWDVLKRYFPNDKNGSRILCTSRHKGVAVSLHAKFHHLRFLNENECWDLLRLKTFRKDSCPPELMETGKKIAKKCQGLPLAIVVISGLLAKNDKTIEWWSHVAESVSSYIVSDPVKYMDTLALSYNYLPQHLKPCFLYFGAFPENYEIFVWQLIWLWVAEGFIRQNDQKSLEEVAEDYLMNLIDRSLVVVSKKRSNGGIKACLVHDLLRDLCLKKSQEENFLQQISRYEHASFSNPFPYKQRRMCIHDNLVDYTSLKHYQFHIRSFLSFGHSVYNLPGKDVSFICQAFKLLRVLNLLSIKILFFPEEIEQLVHLRYLALHVEHEHEHFQPSISNLQNLETFIVDGPKGALFLNDVWKMVKLRHVHTSRLIKIDYPLDDGSPSVLDNLQTIGKLNILDNGDEYVLKRSPNLKKLKCQCYHFPQLEFLIHLEKLNLVYDGYERFSHLGKFPPNLKSITLSNFGLPWKAMSTLGSLPNLKVLKLSYKAFEGPRWDTIDGEFRRLTFLKLQGLDIEQWNVSSNHFPNLQTLVLDDCEWLEEIPSSLGYISTLEMIQVRWCSYSVENSARQLQEQQNLMGNDGLKILVYSLF